jgi:hypothetical protein
VGGNRSSCLSHKTVCYFFFQCILILIQYFPFRALRDRQATAHHLSLTRNARRRAPGALRLDFRVAEGFSRPHHCSLARNARRRVRRTRKDTYTGVFSCSVCFLHPQTHAGGPETTGFPNPIPNPQPPSRFSSGGVLFTTTQPSKRKTEGPLNTKRHQCCVFSCLAPFQDDI